nr:MAG TPA: hypothetical protein [Crassvirales sp.]
MRIIFIWVKIIMRMRMIIIKVIMLLIVINKTL